MTKHECAIIMAYTDVAMLAGSDLSYLYRYLSNIIGRTVYTQELPAIIDQYKNSTIRDDFIALCRNATEEVEQNGE